MDNAMVFTGTANPELANKIVKYLGIQLGDVKLSRFSDGEVSVKFNDSVRGKDCYIIQPASPPVNYNYMELFVMIDALKRSSAQRIAVVLPYYGYACQEKKDSPREPISARLIADFIEAAGATRLITMDLHNGAIQGFFNIPVDHLTARPIFVKYFKEKNIQDMVLVSADEGRAKEVRKAANLLGAPIAVGCKYHPQAMVSSITHLAGDVKGKTPIIIEDMIRTGGSIVECAKALLSNGCNPEIYVAATHGLFTNASFNKLSMPEIKEVVVTDTVPMPEGAPDKFKTVSVADMFAETIKRMQGSESITDLFV